ncbi:MAG: hypothetical protein RBR08_12740 [Desulforegulaceae bacterium]|nr:hypothetical protein [Desulforegulaceae bacterium]
MELGKEYIKRDKFDFEIGYLVKSPCLECPKKEHLPHCQKGCILLNDVQEKIAAGISCSQKI